jgi:hypothetical protein
VRVHAIARQAARHALVGQPHRCERRDPVLHRVADRPAVAERAVHPDRERASGGVADRTVHPDDAVHPVAQLRRLPAAVAGIEHDHARVARGDLDHRRQGARGHRLRPALVILEHQAGTFPAVTAEVDDRGVELGQVAHQVVDADRPPRLETKLVATRRHRELALDRGALLRQRQAVASARVCCQEQDQRSLPGIRGPATSPLDHGATQALALAAPIPGRAPRPGGGRLEAVCRHIDVQFP